MDSKIGHYQTAHEVLEEAVDAFVAKEKALLEKKGIPTSKIEIKTRLARSVGLGDGDAALRALYRALSGELSLPIERAIAICQEIDDFRLIEFCAWRCGLLTAPRAVIEDVDGLDNEDVFAAIVAGQVETARLITLLTTAYQGRPSIDAMNAVEDAHRTAALALEKSALILVRFMEKMLKMGAAGK
jgi:hypothetical protein